MEIFGFICLALLLAFFSLAWVFILFFDGAWGGKREIPMTWIGLIFCAVIYGWVKLFEYSPFAITLNS